MVFFCFIYGTKAINNQIYVLYFFTLCDNVLVPRIVESIGLFREVR